MQFFREGKRVSHSDAALILLTELLSAGYTDEDVSTIVANAEKVCKVFDFSRSSEGNGIETMSTNVDKVLEALDMEKVLSKDKVIRYSIGHFMTIIVSFDGTEEAAVAAYEASDNIRSYEPDPDSEEYEEIMNAKRIFAPVDRKANPSLSLDVLYSQIHEAARLAETSQEQSE